MSVGIYRLIFKNTDKCYVGQTTSLETRLKSHIAIIKSGKGAVKLSSAFKDFGTPELEVLLECLKEDLDKYETEAIEIFNAVDNGFNTLRTGEEMPRPDNSGENNGSSKHTNEEVKKLFLDIYSMLDKRPIEISKVLNIPITLVSVIINGINHTWLENEYPIEYANMLSKRGTRSNGKSAKDRGIEYPIILSPNNEEHTVTNIRQFAMLNNLERGCLNRLLNGNLIKDGN
jgi:group I intron endonuclease